MFNGTKRIVGIKLTHDAAVAMIDGDNLVFSIELEKIGNNQRYTTAKSMRQIEDVLASEDVDLDTVDVFVIDGWKKGTISANQLPTVAVAPYHEFDGQWDGGPNDWSELQLEIGGKQRRCVSYPHLTGHVVGAYVTAAFAGEDAHCIVWDGGITPRLYKITTMYGLEFIAQLGKFAGSIYNIMGLYAGPYKRQDIIDGTVVSTAENRIYCGMDVPGKLMSWIAKGKLSEDVVAVIKNIYDGKQVPNFNGDQTGIPEHEFMNDIFRSLPDVPEENLLLALHTFLERELVAEAIGAIPNGSNLIFVGGSALNIKWNSALRESGHFKSVWVPPFPNDSGSALGTAAAEAYL